MKRLPKVLFLTKYPMEGASSRYRVYQYLEGLQERGLELECHSFFSRTGYLAVFGNAGTYSRLRATMSGVTRRLKSVIGAKNYDLVYLQREALPFGAPLLEQWLKRRRIPFLFDYDDALFIHKPSTISPLASQLRSASRIQKIFTLADAVVAGNQYLKRQAESMGARAHCVEVAEDTKRITARPAHREDEAVVLGWLGSRSTEKYLNLLTPVLQRFFVAFPRAKLLIVGGGEYQAEGVPIEFKPWSLDSELAQLHRFDIGLMPLPIEEWSEGKCGGKARTYMAAGVPPVVQDIGYNRELIRHGETGFLMPASEESWLATLTRLAKDPALRQRVGMEARREVQQRFDKDTITDQLAAILKSEIERAHRISQS